MVVIDVQGKCMNGWIGWLTYHTRKKCTLQKY